MQLLRLHLLHPKLGAYELWQGRQDQTGFGHVTTASLASMRTYAMNSDQFSADELHQLQVDAIRIELPSNSVTTLVSEESLDLEHHPDAANTTTFYDNDDSDSDNQTPTNYRRTT
eukprot:2620512-Ditylum_brightwellii.AAC.1